MGARLQTMAVVAALTLTATTLATVGPAGALTKVGQPPSDRLAPIMPDRSQRAEAIAALATSGKVAGGLAGSVVDADASLGTSAAHGPAPIRAMLSVDIVGDIGSPLLDAIVALGGTVVGSYPRFDGARAVVPSTAVASLAARADVRRVLAAERPIVHRVASVANAVPPNAGVIVDQGDKAHGADTARAQFNVTGAGVKVGVMSDGVDGYDQPPHAAEVGVVTVLPGLAGSGAEGLAMLELVHHLAPGAELLFATADLGPAAMAQHILDLAAAGATIIVDDVTYLTEPAFQDGVISQAVSAVRAQGVLFFSSAGNDGNKDDATSSTWEGDYVAGQPYTLPGAGGSPATAGDLLDFGLASGSGQSDVQNQFFVGSSSGGVTVSLQWSDPFDAPSNDYELIITDGAGHPVNYTGAPPQGQSAFRELTVPPGTAGVAVFRRSGAAARYVRVHVLGSSLDNFNTAGNAWGHNVAVDTISVGAAPAAQAVSPGSPVGPFPGSFTAANREELFSSDGPRHMFFTPTGVAYTPSNFSSTGGIVLQKPEVLGADGVTTSVTAPAGLSPFYGTSAAAPHLAAIAALLRQAAPTASLRHIVQALTLSAIDVAAPGVDRVSGYGIAMPGRALQWLADHPETPADFTPVVPERLLDTRPNTGNVGYSGPKPTAGQTIELHVVGAGATKVPADAAAVVLNVTGTGADADGYVTAWPCGAPRPEASNLNLRSGDTRPNLVVSKIGVGGSVCLYTLSPAHLLADIAGYVPVDSHVVSIVPVRVLDTRSAKQIGYLGAEPTPGQTVELKVTGAAAGVPDDASAVVLNVTGTGAAAGGFVTVWPCGAARPQASNVNLSPGVTTPNLVIAKVGAGGKVCLFTSTTTHLLADLAAYEPATASYRPVVPVRMLDTRPGASQIGYRGLRPVAGQVVVLQMRGLGTNVLPPLARTVVINVTGVDAAGSYVTVWPCGSPRPLASNLNLAVGDARPNLVVTKLGPGETVCLYTEQAANLIADFAGYQS